MRELEKSLGEKLFYKAGRNLVPTESGRVVFRYADEMFSIGQELMDTLKGRKLGQPLRFFVGITGALPKLTAYRLIEPALRLPEPVQVVCYEDKAERLLAELSIHVLDIVRRDMESRRRGQGARDSRASSGRSRRRLPA